MQIKLLVDGGSMKPGPALSQKLGPVGIPINQVIQRVNDATKSFPGLKVPVEINVDFNTKNFDVKVFSPPTSELIKKELGIEKGSGNQKKMNVGNVSIEQIISVAKSKYPNLLSKNLKSAVKTIIGTCVSLGILVESRPASEIEKEIDEGKYDKEINEERIITPEEKKKQLKDYFEKLSKEQDKLLKQEQAALASAQAAADAAKVAAAAPTASTTQTKTPEQVKSSEKAK